MKKLTINIGFITNSSSAIHYFDSKLLEDEDVKAFMKAYEIDKGYIGELECRSTCSSVILTEDDANLARKQLGKSWANLEFKGGREFTVIHGDEYSNLTSEFADLLIKVCKKRYPKYHLGTSEYN